MVEEFLVSDTMQKVRTNKAEIAVILPAVVYFLFPSHADTDIEELA